MLGFDERATLNIVIRTLVRYGEEYHLRVGAGIVHDSVPESEYEETLAKGRALIKAIDEALERDTRIFDAVGYRFVDDVFGGANRRTFRRSVES